MFESYTIYAEIIFQSIAFPFPELICIASCKFLSYKNSLKKEDYIKYWTSSERKIQSLAG